MSTHQYKIICVDDEADIISLMRADLVARGFEVLEARSGSDALAMLAKHGQDVAIVLSDFQMPGMNGFELRQQMLETHREIPFVILSGYVTREHALRSVELKISAILEKPSGIDQIVSVLDRESKDRRTSLDERRTLQACFFEETMEILEDIEPLLLHLESTPDDPTTIDSIFRLVHTVKGASGVLERPDLTRFVHLYEDLLSQIKSGALTATPDVMSVLLRAFDQLGRVVEAFQAGGGDRVDFKELFALFEDAKVGTPAGAVKKSGKSAERPNDATVAKKDVITVPTDMLDQFMSLSGEVTVIRNMVNKLVRSIEKRMPGDDDVSLLADLLEEMHKINSSMQSQIADLRKVPVASVVRKLPRAVRDLARQLDKQVELKVLGDGLRVDKALGQALGNCLIHMVRNCVDHGLESPAARQSKNKPAAGTIELMCEEVNDNVVVVVKDDGKGLDTARIKRKLIEKGMPAIDVEALSRRQLFATIMESGFSTAEKITDISGRGVGMDMVRASIAGLKGRIDIDSEIDKGTSFRITVPIPKSVVIMSSLIISVRGQDFAIPQDNIVRLLQLDAERQAKDLDRLDGGAVLTLEGRLVPLIELGDLLGLARQPSRVPAGDLQIIIVSAEHQVFGLVVDAILDAEDIVVKSLHAGFEGLKAFGGATFMGDGSIGLIIDVAGLRELAGLVTEVDATRTAVSPAQTAPVETHDVLLFSIDGRSTYGAPLSAVYRFEEIAPDQFQTIGSQSVVIYREAPMSFYDLGHLLGLESDAPALADGNDRQPAFIVRAADRCIAFGIRKILDVTRYEGSIQPAVDPRPEFAGNLIVGDRLVTMLDLDAILRRLGVKLPERPASETAPVAIAVEAPAVPELAAVVAIAPVSQPVTPDAAVSGWGLF